MLLVSLVSLIAALLLREFFISNLTSYQNQITDLATQEKVKTLYRNYSSRIDSVDLDAFNRQTEAILRDLQKTEIAGEFYSRDIKRYSVGIVLLMVVFTASVFLLLFIIITRPLSRLLAATETLKQGNFDIQVKESVYSPLNDLIVAFNAMVSELNASRERLIEAEKQTIWQEMARAMAHEIKNPLTPIRLAAQRLEAKYHEQADNLPLVLEKSLRIINEDGVWETVDGGETWGIKSTEADWTEPGWQPAWHFGSGPGTSIGGDLSDPDTYYWVNQQFVYGSFDGGLTFRGLHTREVPPGSNQWQSTGIDNTEVYDLEISKAVPNLIYIGLWDMGIWRSRDHGDTWQSCNQDEFGWEGGRGGDVWTILTDPARPEVVWAGSLRTASNGRPSSHLIRSDNFGEPGSWRETGDGLPNPQLAAEIWGLSLAPNSPTDRRTLFVTAGNAVYRSQDDGNHWEKVFSGGRARITAVDSSDNNLVYAGGDGGFWRSLDGGDTWEKTGLAEMRGIFDIKPDPSNPGWVYVTCYGNDLGLYRSKDGGATWEKLWTNNVARSGSSPKASRSIAASIVFCHSVFGSRTVVNAWRLAMK
jgi:HAMP domain-containing protein